MIKHIQDTTKAVKWPDLYGSFFKLYPRAIESVVEDQIPAMVIYVGVRFEIRPILTPTQYGLKFDFEVWGPPFVNNFPNSH